MVQQYDMQALQQLSLAALAQCCQDENERFRRSQPHDPRYGYELFRRALAERDELAWEYLYQIFSPLVERWVRRSSVFARSGESSEFLVGAVFFRFWRAITPERFASFPNLSALLHYLRCCASGAVIDSVRTQSWAEMLPEEALSHELASEDSPDAEALNSICRVEFWSQLNALLNGEAERVVMYCSFVLGMRPGDIYDRCRSLFTQVADIYSVRRNVLKRLSRHHELRHILS
jgi:hypothetical protein